MLQRQYKPAAKELSKAIAKNVKGNQAHLDRAYCYYPLKAYDKATADLAYLKEQGETSFQYYSLKSLVELDQKQYQAAINTLSEGLRAYPDNHFLWGTYGYTQIENNNLEEGYKALQHCLKLDSTYYIAYNSLGWYHYQKKDYIKAEEMVKKSLEIDPTNSYAYRNLGFILKATGDAAGACRAWKRAEYLGFSTDYDNEVKDMLGANCGS